jgi:hypothetical protein
LIFLLVSFLLAFPPISSQRFTEFPSDEFRHVFSSFSNTVTMETENCRLPQEQCQQTTDEYGDLPEKI